MVNKLQYYNQRSLILIDLDANKTSTDYFYDFRINRTFGKIHKKIQNYGLCKIIFNYCYHFFSRHFQNLIFSTGHLNILRNFYHLNLILILLIVLLFHYLLLSLLVKFLANQINNKINK